MHSTVSSMIVTFWMSVFRAMGSFVWSPAAAVFARQWSRNFARQSMKYRQGFMGKPSNSRACMSIEMMM